MNNKIDDITLLKYLDKGGFAEIFLSKKKGVKELLATKRIDQDNIMKNPILKKYLENEIIILNTIKHPNIIRLYDVKTKPDYIYITMEYCNGGSLLECLKKYYAKNIRPFTEDIVQYLMKQILSGVKCLHDHKVIHRDLKLANILLNYKSENDLKNLNIFGAQVKIIDFNASTKPGSSSAQTAIGTIPNMAPSVIGNLKGNHNEYDEKVDIWSLGTICYEMLFGKELFKEEQLLNNIKDCHVQIPDNISTNAKSFLLFMLQKDSQKRSSVNELLKHPFLNNANNVNNIQPYYNSSNNNIKYDYNKAKQQPQYQYQIKDNNLYQISNNNGKNHRNHQHQNVQQQYQIYDNKKNEQIYQIPNNNRNQNVQQQYQTYDNKKNKQIYQMPNNNRNQNVHQQFKTFDNKKNGQIYHIPNNNNQYQIPNNNQNKNIDNNTYQVSNNNQYQIQNNNQYIIQNNNNNNQYQIQGEKQKQNQKYKVQNGKNNQYFIQNNNQYKMIDNNHYHMPNNNNNQQYQVQYQIPNNNNNQQYQVQYQIPNNSANQQHQVKYQIYHNSNNSNNQQYQVQYQTSNYNKNQQYQDQSQIQNNNNNQQYQYQVQYPIQNQIQNNNKNKEIKHNQKQGHSIMPNQTKTFYETKYTNPQSLFSQYSNNNSQYSNISVSNAYTNNSS